MATTDYGSERSRSGGAGWFYVPIVLILFLGGAMSVGAYAYNDVDLTVMESLAAGFGGLAALIFGLFAAAIGIIIGLFTALIGLVVAGGAVATTLFIIGSPILAIILIVMLMRRPKSNCPDPAAHELD